MANGDDSVANLAQISQALRATFPELSEIMPLCLLGDGFRSIAIETADGHVFRVAKNSSATSGHLKELELLPLLRDAVSIAIPEPVWYAEPSALFPFGVVGYTKIQGQPLTPTRLRPTNVKQIAADIAGFLRELHDFRIEKLTASISPINAAARQSLRDDVLPTLRNRLTVSEYQTVTRWWEALLCDNRMHCYTPALQHGDLWYENILTDDAAETVVGVVDFESAAVGDPAQDFATQRHLGDEFANRVVDAYLAAGGALDADFPHRMQRLWELREFDGLQFAIRFDDAEEFEDSICKLRNGPVLNP